jgi:hypothetical protein
MIRERSLRRLEISGRNRDQSLRLKILRKTEREAVRADSVALSYFEKKELCDSQFMRFNRWKQKLRNSPLAVDLVQEDRQRLSRLYRDTLARARSVSETREMNQRIEQVVLEQGYIDNPVEIAQLRREKRDLLLQFRQLRAMRDVERANSRGSLCLSAF